MVATRPDVVDPVFAEVAKVVLGPDVDVRELWAVAKGMPDTSAVSTPGTAGPPSKKKALGAGLALGTVAEGDSVLGAAKTAFPKAAAAAVKIAEPVTHVLRPILSSVPKIPGMGDGKARFAIQATNFGLGLAAAHELLKKPKPAAGTATPVAKLRNPIRLRRQAEGAARFAGRTRTPTPGHAKDWPGPKHAVRPSRAKRALALAAVGTTGAGVLDAQQHDRLQPADLYKADITWTGQIAKLDTDKRQVFGWCSLSKVDGHEVIDLQGDYIPIEETEASAYRYVLESRKGGDMHRRVKKGLTTNFGDEPEHTSDLVESFVVTPEKLEKMGLAQDALPLGWWVGFKVNDEHQWNLVKNGERTGFSIHGSGHRRPYDEIAKYGKPAAIAAEHVAHIERVAHTHKAIGKALAARDESVVHAYADGVPSRFLNRAMGKPDSHPNTAMILRKAGGPDQNRARLADGHPKIAEHVARISAAHENLAKTRSAHHEALLDAHLAGVPTGQMARGMGVSQPTVSRKISQIVERAGGKDVSKGERTDRVVANIKARARSARNPGPVTLVPVTSTAVKAIGYQKPTRRLAVQMHSRAEPYVYRAKPKVAAKVTGAKSIGRAYTSEIRGQAKRNPKLNPADRVRSFAARPKETAS